MSDGKLIEAAKADDLSTLEGLVAAGADVNEQDEQGWTPLNWAAGKGSRAAVELLLKAGADASKVGRDQRTPYMIALAAGHAEVARLLQDAGDAGGASRPYCKAVSLEELRRFPGWPGAGREDGAGEKSQGEDVVFIHQDFTVTRLMWHGEDVIFAGVTPEWETFCRDVLKFKALNDLDLVAARQ